MPEAKTKSGSYGSWPADFVRIIVVSGALGFWMAAVEAIFSLPRALPGAEAGLGLSQLIAYLPRFFSPTPVLDSLVGLGMAGMVLGFISCLVCAPLAWKGLSGFSRERFVSGTLVVQVSALVILMGWFYFPALMPGPESFFWSRLPWLKYALVVLGGAGFLIYQHGRFRRQEDGEALVALVLQATWIAAAFALLEVIRHFRGLVGLPARAALALAVVAGCYLCYRLSRKAALKLILGAVVRRTFARSLVACAYGLLAGAAYLHFWGFARLPSLSGEAGRGPNLVMLVLDTVRADRLSCYGHNRRTTPFLEELCHEGARFTRAYTPSPWTLPSHASFFTGLYPSEHGSVHGHWELNQEFITLAERLKERGYLTLGYSSNPWISPSTNLDQGFDRLLHPRNLFIGLPRLSGEKLFRYWLVIADPSLVRDSGGAQANAAAKGWIKELADRERPFFMFVNYMEAHPPYPGLPETFKFFPAPELARTRVQEIGFNWIAFDSGAKKLGEEELEAIRAWYDGCIYYLDQRVEELYRELEKQGLASNTVFVVLSDHGESIGEHGLWGHAFSMYTGLLHVPLIIRYPEVIPSGIEVDAVFSLKGLPQLLMELVSGKYPGVMAAQSRDVYKNTPVFSERYRPLRIMNLMESRFAGFDRTRFDRDQRSVLGYPYHFIWDSRGSHELYRLDTDPGELTNLAPTRRDIYRDLGSLVDEFRAAHPRPTSKEKQRIMDPETRQRLRDLGYIK